MVTHIQNGITHILTTAERGYQLSNEQSQSMVETEQSFAVIATHIANIHHDLQHLIKEMGHTNDMSQQVNRTIENISAITEETAAGTEEISAISKKEIETTLCQIQKR